MGLVFPRQHRHTVVEGSVFSINTVKSSHLYEIYKRYLYTLATRREWIAGLCDQNKADDTIRNAK